MDFKIKNIPDELKFNALWCCWKLVDGKKLPFNPRTGQMARSNDKTTFAAFKVALNNLSKYLVIDDNNVYKGGLAMGVFNDYSAIDIDHCVENGTPNAMAQEIIDFMDSYTEISPSGTGIRIIFKTHNRFQKGEYYINNAKLGLEIYISDNTNKFLTITGNALRPNTIRELDITPIMDKYMKRTNGKPVTKPEAKPIASNIKPGDINAFLGRDKKLAELWNATAPGAGSNENELDCGLIGKLMFYYGNDIEKVNELFMESPYYNSKDDAHRAKWDRDDYRDGIFGLTHKAEVYNPVAKALKTYQLNDTGNAHRFKEMFNGNARYNYDNKCWMTWNGEYWQHDVCSNIKNYAELLIEQMRIDAVETFDEDLMRFAKRSASSSGKANMLKEAEHLLPVRNATLDQYKDYININNGTLNLRTMELFNHNPDFYMTKKANVNYVKNAQPVRFIRFLNEIFEGDQEKIAYVRKIMAYGLTGEIDDQKFIIFYGDGANGKSVLIEVMRSIMGDYATTANKTLLVDAKYNQGNNSNSEVARLMGKRTVFVSETRSGDVLSDAFVKNITGGEEITARFLYGNEFTYRPEFTAILITNHMPRINIFDKAILRRLVPIKFGRIFAAHEQNINLVSELLEEKDEIFSWVADDCWYKERLGMPGFVTEAIEEVKEEMDYLQKWLNERTELNPNEYVPASHLFQSFNQYCIQNRFNQMSSTAFGRIMNSKEGFTKERRMNGVVYVGIKLRDTVRDVL